MIYRRFSGRLAFPATMALFIAVGMARTMPAQAMHAVASAAKGVRLADAPNFALMDSLGKVRSLNDFRRHPVALYFFCGCDWCHQCARIWGQMQRAGALGESASPSAERPLTLVVFQGNAAESTQFARETGLESSQTVLLADETMRVTLDMYHAEVCPRVFVISRQGKVVYTNNHKNDMPREAPAELIASRALDAIRRQENCVHNSK